MNPSVLRSLVAAAAVIALPQVAFAQLIGDKDCFGTLFGSPAVCNGPFSEPFTGADGRDALEKAAGNGAQQTDYYSSLFGQQLPQQFSLIWNLPGVLLGGSVEYRAYGLQATQLDPFRSTFNGIVETGFVNFQDGFNVVRTFSFSLTGDMITRANTDGFLSVSLERNGSKDLVAWDYFEFTGRYAASVPEPSTLVLLGMGVGLLGVARRRRLSV